MSVRLAMLATILLALVTTACVATREEEVARHRVAMSLAALGGGLVGKAGYVAGAFVDDSQKRKLVHGRWCGAGFPSDADIAAGTRVFPEPRGGGIVVTADSLMPTDEIDEACARHDMCYLGASQTQTRGGIANCDTILMCELYKISEMPKAELAVPLATVLAWVGGAGIWNHLSSDCRRLGADRIRKLHFVSASLATERIGTRAMR